MIQERLLEALHDATPAEVIEAIRSGRAQLWLGERAGMVTELIEEPVRTVHVWLAGGDLGEVLAFIPGIAAWARARGCKQATVQGRKGWTRALRPYGFEPVDGELRKVL